AAMACETRNATVGLMVACNAYRNPDLYAHMVTTVDHLSGGRAVLGIGAGWFERDFQEYGIEFGTPGDRLRGLEAGLKRIQARAGKPRPQPLGRLPPSMGGGGAQAPLPLGAQYPGLW